MAKVKKIKKTCPMSNGKICDYHFYKEFEDSKDCIHMCDGEHGLCNADYFERCPFPSKIGLGEVTREGVKHGDMNDQTGKLPKIKSKKDALKEILIVASDTRSHVLLGDLCDWLELKMSIIKKFAKKGLKL